jgi:predicted phage baseplate assembly protein
VPLASFLPTIDDRRYDDIVAEARARIPRYTPEWTDLNDSDPGITLVELLAWLTEMQLYRLGQVPELNYLKFLDLLGMELLPAAPATVEITFPPEAGATTASVDVPRGTQVSAEGSDGGAPVVFETDRTLIVATSPLTAVQAFDGYAYADRTAENADASSPFQALGIAAAGAALYLGFDPTVPFPPRELDLTVFAPERRVTGALSCAELGKGAHAPARLRWEYWNGTSWRTIETLADESLALTRTGHVRLRMPPVGALAAIAVGNLATPRFYVRALLLAPTYERAPELFTIRPNTVSATQAVTVRSEILGGSTGGKDAEFSVANAPVLPDSLRLEIDEGDGPRTWTEVADFFASGKRDRHFMLDRTSGVIRFGDGVNGAIPVANPSLPDANIVAVVYRYGGGARGNVAAGRLTTLVSPVDGIDAGAVANLRAATGGREEETLEQAKVRVPRAIRSRERAVTAEDFEQLTLQVGGVRRAKALPFAHPDFPGVPVPGAVTVIVVPDGTAPNPVPSEGTLRNVCDYLGARRLITTEVYVVPPRYRLVRVAAEVTAASSADLGAVKQDIEEALDRYFHPLTGGEDGTGWPFGEDIYFSRVFGRVSVEGVRSVDRLTISVDGEGTDVCTNVRVCDGVLLYADGHDVTVTYQDG